MAGRPEELAQEVAAALLDGSRRVHASEFPGNVAGLGQPGLYAWFVDEAGARTLSRGLGHAVEPGLIYAGQAGAGSTATLASRVGRQHLRGNVRGSTFRFTLAAVLAGELGLQGAGGRHLAGDGESKLTGWMLDHLAVAVVPIDDHDIVGGLERLVLARLDPPLNLEGMGSTALRTTLSALRHRLTSVAARGSSQPRTLAEVPTTQPAPLTSAASRLAPDMTAHLESLVGRTILTLTRRPNRIVSVRDGVVWVATSRSPGGQPVDIADVQDAADRLFARRELTIDVATVGHRSAFVGAVLATLPGTRPLLRPRRIILDS